MTDPTSDPRVSFWKRTRRWLEAIDEAVHTTEAELVAKRVDRLEARIAQLEVSARLSVDGAHTDGRSIATERTT